MREYGQVQSAFWQSTDAQAFSDRGKLLALYLLCGPHTNGIGCFRVGDGAIMDDLGWNQIDVQAAFAELCGNGFARRENSVVFLPNFLRWNKIVNVNIAKARFSEFLTIPKGNLKILAAQAMLEFSDHWTQENRNALEMVSYTPLAPSENQNPTQPNPTQPRENPNPLVRNRVKRTKLPIDASGFDRFYAAYPRKVSKSSALKAFTKLAPSPELLETMLVAVKAQAATPKWRNEPQYIPHPATWINQARWEDDIGSITRTGRMAEPSKTHSGIAALQGLKNRGQTIPQRNSQLALERDSRRPFEADEPES